MAAVAGYTASIRATSQPSVGFTDEAMTDSGDHTTYTVTNAAHQMLDRDVAVVVQKSTDSGATWSTITTGFTLYRVYARVVFGSAQSAGTLVRLHSGSYYVINTIGYAMSAEFASKFNMADTTVIGGTGEETSIPTTFSGTVKLNTVWISTARAKSLQARDLLILDFQVAGDKYSGYCYAGDSNLKADTKAALLEDLTFTLTDEFLAS